MISTICLIITHLVGISQIKMVTVCKLVMLVKVSLNWLQKSCLLFLYESSLAILWNLVARIEQLNERERHIPPQTDTVVRFAPEYVALVLFLCNLVNMDATRFLRITAFLTVLLITINILCNLCYCEIKEPSMWVELISSYYGRGW